jgi:signal transduction histidine kinase
VPELADPRWRQYRVEIVWWIFVLINAACIHVFREWATVPFHFIWISLSLLYGWRVWALRPTTVTLTAVVIVTSVALGSTVITGDQALDELTEIPLMAAVFAVMVLFVRRSVAAREEISRVYDDNVELLDYARHLIRHASHIVRTPLTIALGHAEILHRTTSDAEAESDAQVVIDELKRLKETTDRLLELATSHQPDFVHPQATPVREVLTDACDKWSAKGELVRLGKLDDAVMRVDGDRLLEALDELIGNALAVSSAESPVEISAQHDNGWEVIAVADRGPGIREDDQKPIFDRFTRADGSRRRGARLGLAIVKAITEAHGGSVRAQDRAGGGAVVEMRLPLQPPEARPAAEALPTGAAH